MVYALQSMLLRTLKISLSSFKSLILISAFPKINSQLATTSEYVVPLYSILSQGLFKTTLLSFSIQITSAFIFSAKALTGTIVRPFSIKPFAFCTYFLSTYKLTSSCAKTFTDKDNSIITSNIKLIILFICEFPPRKAYFILDNTKRCQCTFPSAEKALKIRTFCLRYYSHSAKFF